MMKEEVADKTSNKQLLKLFAMFISERCCRLQVITISYEGASLKARIFSSRLKLNGMICAVRAAELTS